MHQISLSRCFTEDLKQRIWGGDLSLEWPHNTLISYRHKLSTMKIVKKANVYAVKRKKIGDEGGMWERQESIKLRLYRTKPWS